MIRINHERGNETLSYRWGYWHMSVFQRMVYFLRFGKLIDESHWSKPLSERTQEEIAAEGELFDWRGSIVATEDMQATDESDGEVVTVLKGDIIRIY